MPGSDDAAFLILSVQAGEQTIQYQFPVYIVWNVARPAVGAVAELSFQSSTGWLVDGWTENRFIRLLLGEIYHAKGPGKRGSGLIYQRFSSLPPEFSTNIAIHRPDGEQSNTSVIVGEFILKAFRKLEPGVHPELEMGRYLTRVGFRNIPQMLASIELACYGTNAKTVVCILQSLIPDSLDGWALRG
jgi:hypothetical protein